MMKQSENEQGFSALDATLVIVIVILIGAVGWLVYQNHHKSTPTSRATSSKSAPTSTTTFPKTTNGDVTYNNGTLVPEDSQAKAKAAGFYCPSWDPKPGEASPDLCTNLDK